MNIPSEVAFGGHVAKVRLLPNESMLGKGTGSYDTWSKRIALNADPDLPESVQSEAFFHELMEMVKNTLNLTLSHEELTVLSESMFAIIRNNKLDFTDKKEWVDG